MNSFWAGFEKRGGLRDGAAPAAERVLDYSKMRQATSSIPMWKRKLQESAVEKGRKAASSGKRRLSEDLIKQIRQATR